MSELPNQSAWLLGVFYQALIEWGVKEDELYAQFGLDLGQLEKMVSPVSTNQFKQLGDIAQKLTHRPDIGLILGKDAEYNEDKGGIVLNIAVNSPTIRCFLRDLEELSSLFKEIVTFSIKEKKDICEIYIDFFKAYDMGLPLIEYYLSGFISTLKHLVGSEFRPMQVNLQYPAPHYIDSYHYAFDTRLKFNQDMTSIILQRKHLDLPTPRPVSIVKELLSKVVGNHLQELNKNTLFQTEVRKLIVKRLPHGEVGIKSISQALNLHRGVIYRKLREENTSYKNLLTVTRKQLAKQHLKNSSLNIDMVSSLLGYTESSAFNRAFKRWFGMNPGEYRKQSQIES